MSVLCFAVVNMLVFVRSTSARPLMVVLVADSNVCRPFIVVPGAEAPQQVRINVAPISLPAFVLRDSGFQAVIRFHII